MLTFILNNLSVLIEKLDNSLFFETGVTEFKINYELSMFDYIEVQKHFLEVEDLDTTEFIVEMSIYGDNKIILTFKLK